MRKLLFLFNPRAGTGKIASGLSKIIDILTKENFLVSAYPTQAKADAFSKILEWDTRFERVVVAGGDGILHEAVNAFMNLEKRPDLGYIPAGTTNDFATSHKISKKMEDAAKLAAGESRRLIDIGSFGNNYFSYVAAFGVGTDVPYLTDQNSKNILGPLAYFINALKYVDLKTFSASCRKMKITTDNEIFEGKFAFGIISNSKSVAGMKQLVPRDSKMDDGLLEGLFVRKPTNIMEADHIINGLLYGNLNNEGLLSVKSSKFNFETDEKTPWTLDGEDGGTHTFVTIENRRQSLNMLLP